MASRTRRPLTDGQRTEDSQQQRLEQPVTRLTDGNSLSAYKVRYRRGRDNYRRRVRPSFFLSPKSMSDGSTTVFVQMLDNLFRLEC